LPLRRQLPFVLALAALFGACTRAADSDPDAGAPTTMTSEVGDRLASTTIAALQVHGTFAGHLGEKGAIAREGEGWKLAGHAGSLSAKLPRDARAPLHVARSGREDFWIEVSAEDVRPVVGVAIGAALVFPSATSAIDIVHVAEPSRVEEIRVLHEGAAPGARWTIRTGPAVASVRLREGAVEVVDASGFVGLRSAPMFVLDARGVRREVTARLEGDRLVATFDARDLAYPIALDPVWTSGGVLTQPREDHAATLLATGKVIVVGSDGGRTSDLYDHTSNTWSAGPLISIRRINPATVLLADGRALVTGGKSDTPAPTYVISTCEVYNPSTNTFAPTGSMSSPRWLHTATVLSSGKVLVVGGANSYTEVGVSTSELYDPTTGLWTATGSLPSAHHGHSAIRLASGKVLIAGRTDSLGGDGSAQLYDPSAGTWSAAGTMLATRDAPSMVLLASGKVLVAGGRDTTSTFKVLSSAEVYDPSTNSWSAVASMPTERSVAGSSILPSGHALLVGGYDSAGELASAVAYDPIGNRWGTAMSLPAARSSMPVVKLLSGAALAIGGHQGFSGGATSAELFNQSPNGTACAGSGECTSANCVDGVCCDKPCAGQCEYCKSTGSVGTCKNVTGAAFAPRPACSAGSGDPCKAQKCDGVDAVACHYPAAGVVACSADACSAGVETHTSVCDGAGSCGDVAKSCGSYACGTTACKKTCATKSDCASGAYCSSSVCISVGPIGATCTDVTGCTTGLFCTDGVCCAVAACAAGSSCSAGPVKGTCSKLDSSSCTADSECASGMCVDGFCCDSKCTGACEACDVIGKAGKCTPVTGKPHGARPACPKDASDVCSASTCDGTDTTKCAAFAGTDVSCREPSCKDGTATASTLCDGTGKCPAATTSPCGAYTCADDGKECRNACAKPTDCSTGNSCIEGKCRPTPATCTADGTALIGIDGTSKVCAPYICKSNACLTQCESSTDCASGNVCDTATKVCAPASTQDTTSDSGGCSVGHGTSHGGARWLLVVLGAIVGVVIRRRRRIETVVVALASVAAGCASSEPTAPATPPAPAVSSSHTAVSVVAEVGERAVFRDIVARAEPLARTASGFQPSRPRVADGWSTAHLRVAFPSEATGSTHLSVDDDEGVWLDVRASDLRAVGAGIDERAIVFANAAIDTDVLHLASFGGAEELRVLRGPSAPSTATYALTVGPSCGARLREGRVEVVDSKGLTRISSAPMFAIDAHGVRREVEVQLEPTRTGYTLRTFLDTTKLAYPIVVDPAWSTTASMATERVSPRLTSLASGKVLLTGGYGSGFVKPLESQLYDPSAGSWTTSGTMKVGRWGHSATRLLTGNVLVVGGDSPCTAELYDASLGTWAFTTSPTTEHTYQGSVLLSSGKVLVVGGGTSAAELYDPTTKVWASAGSMSYSRSYHTATLLSSGSVLVVGGTAVAGTDTTAELWDGSTSWSLLTAKTMNGRFFHTATLLGGDKVLIAGGYGAYSTCEIYDPTAKTFTPSAPMANKRTQHTATALTSGKVLVAGGGITTAEVYDPSTDTWAPAGDVAGGPYDHAAERMSSGSVLLCGGSGSGGGASKACQIFTSLANGGACTGAGECLSGRCVDGYCCNSACTQQCGACDVPGSLGTCTAVTGAVHGSRTTCADGSGDPCKATKCDGSDLVACHLPAAGLIACGTNSCSAGIETHTSTCDGAGKCADVPKTCDAYLCDTTTCKTTCTTIADCSPGHWCSAGKCLSLLGLGDTCPDTTACPSGLYCTDGVCCGLPTCGTGSSCSAGLKKGVCAKINGSVCGSDLECGSGHCVDGVCCDGACTGQCEACDVGGSAGKCTPVAGAVHGARTACTTDTKNVCASQVCDGTDTTKCAGFVGSTVSCRAQSCKDGVKTVAASCTAGACPAAITTPCGGFACNDTGKDCRTSCATDAECIPGDECVTGTCRPKTAKCSADNLSAIDPAGKATACAPFVCRGGACLAACTTTDDCQAGLVCDTASKTCVPLSNGAETGSSGGCGVGGSSSTRDDAGLGLVVAIGLYAVRRRRR